jgi:hypothetical protein
MSLFDKLQVHRSMTGEVGPYFEITAPTDEAATILGTGTSSFTLNGLTLLLEVDNGAEQTLTFVSADPIAIDDVVDFVNDPANGLTGITASEDTGALRLTSNTLGTGSSIEITGGTALTELGFTNGDRIEGKDERIALVVGTSDYEYDDQNGDPDYYYQVRYYNSGTGAVSSFGPPAKGDVGSVLAPSDLIKSTIDLAGMDGKPMTDTEILIYNKYIPPLEVGDYLITGRDLMMVTDQIGHAETMLVRGATISVAIAGTSIVREITVPTTGTEFKLNAALATADDMFQVQVPDIPAAVRRTL